MIPEKKYRPEDILRLGWRYRWVIVVPTVLVSAATFAGARYLPNRYRSETLILVVPQRVPETYVRSTVTARIEDRLQSISQQILSRSRLERVIQDFNLYQNERARGIMQDIVEQMHSDIEVQTVKGDAFRVAYTGEDPRTVMRVTERLASLFIDESLRDREVLAEGTNLFLQAQLDDARRQLIEHEKKLEAYRRRHDGELPSQTEANLQTIRSTEMQLQSLTESLNRDRDQKLLFERQIADSSVPDTDAPTTAAGRGSDPANAPATGSAAQQLQNARVQLQAMQLRLKPQHPDVVRLKREVAERERAADVEELERPLSADSAPDSANPLERTRLNRMQDLLAQVSNLERAIAAKQTNEKRLRSMIGAYQARLAAGPTRESELTELTRDYDTLQKTYQSLLAKHQESKVSVNLERRQIGEQFKVLDPARIPEKPFSPNRVLINAAGLAGGLTLGIALVALLEYRDSSLRSEADVAVALALPVLAFIPVMTTTHERQTRHRRKLWLSFTTLVAIVGTAAVLAWKLRG